MLFLFCALLWVLPVITHGINKGTKLSVFPILLLLAVAHFDPSHG